jgi:hypothetical protein
MKGRSMKALQFLLAAALLCGCDDDSDPTAPDLDVRGNYSLAALTFDPQGSLPAVDLLARITGSIPRLVLVTGGRAQLVFEDPSTGLVTTADASYSITNSGDVSVSFDEGSTMYRGSFLSRRMTFAYDSAQRSLTFAGASPDGIDRQRLLAVVPEWAQEQLFDPVPGSLQVIFRVDTP